MKRLWVLAFAAGCAGGDTDAPVDTDPAVDTDADTAPSDTDVAPVDTDVTAENVRLAGVCPDATHWGAFFVDQNPDYAYVTGSASDGVVPVTVRTHVQTDGDCTIWRKENPFCDGGCDPGFTCDLTGACVRYPETQDLGVVTVAGLHKPISMTARQPGNSYFDTSLDNPPWTPGDVFEVRTGGGAYAPVTLYGVAPMTLVPVSMDWTVVGGQPLTVRWSAPVGATRSEVVLTLRIDQHGLTPSQIVCTFDDVGTGTVPAAIIDGLVSLGVTGFPAGDLTRRTADSAPLGDDGGCIDLLATSSRLANITIDGYTPCTLDEQCPEGLTCNELLERCE